MPYKNRTKIFAANETYHLYGRGVNKMNLFSDDEDYVFFTYLFKKYLTPNFKEPRFVRGRKIEIPIIGVSDQIELYAYCFMFNHFHLLAKSLEKNGVSNLMRRVLTTYSNYFNTKYDRQGPLIQGSYRAVRITKGEQFVYVSRYIHLNPVQAGIVKKAAEYSYTSYNNYLNKRGLKWMKLDPQLLGATEYHKIEQYIKDIKEDENSGIIV